MIKNFIIHLMFCFCLQSFAQVGEYKTFFDNLVEDTTSVDMNIVEYNRYWEDFITVDAKEILKPNKSFNKSAAYLGSYKRPNLQPFLDRKLFLGDREVFEGKSKKANEMIGFAICESGKPTIIYAFKQNPKICMEAFVFFREHEYAHLKLGHTGCGVSSNTVDNHQKEMDADLEARNTILELNDGTRIIDFILGTFQALNLKQDRYHPSSKDRIQNLMQIN